MVRSPAGNATMGETAGAIVPTGAKGHGKLVAFVAFSVFREWEGPSSSIIIEKPFAPSLFVTCVFCC